MRVIQLPTLEEMLDAADGRRPLTRDELTMAAALPEDNYAKTRNPGLTLYCPRCRQCTTDFHVNDSYCRLCRNEYERERQARLRRERNEKIGAEEEGVG